MTTVTESVGILKVNLCRYKLVNTSGVTDHVKNNSERCPICFSGSNRTSNLNLIFFLPSYIIDDIYLTTE